jgi:hypothetical protein
LRRNLDQECCDLIGAEDSSTARAADAKFDSAREYIIDPAVDAEAGKLDEADTGQPRKQRFEATRVKEKSANGEGPEI